MWCSRPGECPRRTDRAATRRPQLIDHPSAVNQSGCGVGGQLHQLVDAQAGDGASCSALVRTEYPENQVKLRIDKAEQLEDRLE